MVREHYACGHVVMELFLLNKQNGGKKYPNRQRNCRARWEFASIFRFLPYAWRNLSANERSGRRSGCGSGGKRGRRGRGARNGGRFMLPRLVSHTYIVNLTLPSPLRLPGEKLAKLDGKAWKSWDVFAAFSGFYPTIKPLVREEDSKYMYFASSKNTIETLASKLLINGRNSSRGERTSILVV